MFGGDVKQGVVLGKSINDVMDLRCIDYFQSSDEFHPFLMGEVTWVGGSFFVCIFFNTQLGRIMIGKCTCSLFQTTKLALHLFQKDPFSRYSFFFLDWSLLCTNYGCKGFFASLCAEAGRPLGLLLEIRWENCDLVMKILKFTQVNRRIGSLALGAPRFTGVTKYQCRNANEMCLISFLWTVFAFWF